MFKHSQHKLKLKVLEIHSDLKQQQRRVYFIDIWLTPQTNVIQSAFVAWTEPCSLVSESCAFVQPPTGRCVAQKV